MQYKFIAMAAVAVALVPAAAMAQSKTTKDSSMSHRAADSSHVTATAAGDVAGPGTDVTGAMMKAQQDPNIIGSPAWWNTHATADGKPKSEARKP